MRYKSIISIFRVTNLFQVAIHDDEYAVASVRLLTIVFTKVDRVTRCKATAISYLKCCVLPIGKENQDCKTFLLGHHKLPLLRQVSDLGVIFDDKLRFSSHINHIVCKAHRCANLILRCFVSKDVV